MAKNTKGAASWRPAEPADMPYQKARREWDARIGATVVQAANWRLVAFAQLGLLLVASVGMIVLGAQPKAVPHLVQVDKLGAASRAAEREVRRPRRARCGRPSGGAGCSRRCSRT